MSTLEGRLREWMRNARECDDPLEEVRLRRWEMVEFLEMLKECCSPLARGTLERNIWRLKNGLSLMGGWGYSYMTYRVRMVGP